MAQFRVKAVQIVSLAIVLFSLISC